MDKALRPAPAAFPPPVLGCASYCPEARAGAGDDLHGQAGEDDEHDDVLYHDLPPALGVATDVTLTTRYQHGSVTNATGASREITSLLHSGRRPCAQAHAARSVGDQETTRMRNPDREREPLIFALGIVLSLAMSVVGLAMVFEI
jgi:hypothetical protein